MGARKKGGKRKEERGKRMSGVKASVDHSPHPTTKSYRIFRFSHCHPFPSFLFPLSSLLSSLS
jgi:hypothetical protein